MFDYRWSMEPRASAQAEATPLLLALDGFATALDHLVKVVDDRGLDELDAAALVEFLQAFEQIRSRMSVIDQAAICGAVARDLPQVLCRRSMNQVLMQAS